VAVVVVARSMVSPHPAEIITALITPIDATTAPLRRRRTVPGVVAVC